MRIIKKIGIVLLVVSGIYSCEQTGFITDPNAGISFSMDTVYFDTVFTEIGTATKSFTIYNNYGEYIKISELRLAGGESSVYRMNVDGEAGILFEDIEIPPKDSIYVFVDANIDPNDADGILLRQDSIVATTNSRVQDIDLVAWAQDVHLYNGEVLETQTWVNDKPYLIINYIYVDSLETLTIEPGVQIYLHNEAIFAVGGTLIAEGDLDNPIRFNGDRLEYSYQDYPGQWGGLWFFAGSRDNRMNYCQIKGPTYGMIVDTVMNENPTLTLSNSIIQHASSIGILGRGSRIEAYNNVVANCSSSAIALTIGGNYEFNHCTFSNTSSGNPLVSSTIRSEPAVYISNYYYYNDTLPNGDVQQLAEVRDVEKAYFGNCIIWGTLSNELTIDQYSESGVLNYMFDHCLGRIDAEEVDTTTGYFPGLIIDNPEFISWEDYNFRLDTLSPAKDMANAEISAGFLTDLDGQDRFADSKPDIGAYERIEE